VRRFPLIAEGVPIVVPLGIEPEFVGYDAESRGVKLSAAWLIERAGIGKGFSLAGSDAALSSKHTLAIINRGVATTDQVLELARYITIRVHDTFGIMLEPEPTMIGFD
jgi:UDP-N-acetylmuramate dehydrogenase